MLPLLREYLEVYRRPMSYLVLALTNHEHRDGAGYDVWDMQSYTMSKCI